MRRRIGSAAIVVGVALLAAAAPKGTVPRTTVDRYPAHIVRDGVGVGVVVLSPEQARKLFVSDVEKCCVVAEIALYPSKDKSLDISLNDFALRSGGSDNASKPASAKVVAASLQKSASSGRDVTVSPVAGIGYESAGYDPVTGTRGGGGTTSMAGVMVGVGANGPRSGSTEKDRAAMETELNEKGLPEGAASAPVSGYVYFPRNSKKKNESLQLVYKINGNNVTLNLSK